MSEYELKLAVIAGASKALGFKRKNPDASEQEVIQHVTEKADEIVKGIDEEG